MKLSIKLSRNLFCRKISVPKTVSAMFNLFTDSILIAEKLLEDNLGKGIF